MESLHDRAGVAFAHHLLGHIYYVQKDYERALRHFEIALSLRQAIRAPQLAAGTIFSMAQVFEAQGSLDRALSMLMEVEHRVMLRQDRASQIMLYNTLGRLYTRKGDYGKAEQSLARAGALLTEVALPVQQRDNYKLLAELSVARGDHKRATAYYDKFITLNDTLFNTRSATKIAEINSLYQLEKKEQALQSLHEQYELKATEGKLQEARIRLQNTFLFSLVLGVVFLIILVFVLFQYYHGKSRANKKLMKLNEEILEQKEEIQAQTEELVDANQSLIRLNNELLEKREELEAQSEELREANETILAINEDLDSIVTRRTHQLKEAYQELDTFFYRSSHDFRRPLTTFLGLAEVAKITVKDGNALELFEKVRETALNLDKMLVKLQSISDVGAQELVYKPVLVGEIFDSVCADFQEDLLHRGIRVQRAITLPDPFVSYPAMVRIIIENLVENSIHFSAPENALLELKAYQENGWVVMSVRDNGYGIPEEYQDKIFDMYFRGNERSKGNGLGLYIVKKAVGKLRGQISVVSAVGQGTKLEVRLPREGRS
jgi:signal transduction histidine kinase